VDLRRKIARLRDAREAPEAPPPVAPPEPVAAPAEPAVDDLRARLKTLSRRTRQRAAAPPAPPPAPWPFDGDPPRHARSLPADARHGDVSVRRALDAAGEVVATLALDPTLRGFEASRALFLDTETTGLAGGTGTVAFLVGMAWFEDGSLRVEQLFLDDLDREPALLEHVAARVRAAGAIVTFNGRSFDLPLLRARFVMARVAPPPEPPHLDLLHVARRIYGARVERCTLTALERDVLGFARVGDIDGAEIPERYLRFLREGEAARPLLAPVVTHNGWDLVALAALTGELGARAARAESEGRFEARDLVGIARTAHRAGDAARAVALAAEAASLGDAAAARDAHVLAARVHKRRRDAERMCERLHDALAHGDDPALHLELARCYERDLDDPARALDHCLRADGAEPAGAHARRLARLRRKAKAARHRQLRLPGVE
jgi:uncharacterized protein YprB with RNaseH-like and TPR domain